MAHYIKDLGSSKDMISLAYTDVSKIDLYNEVNELLTYRNYKKIADNNGTSTYEYGNRTVRIILGAFKKYFKFHVLINEIDMETLELRIVRATTGMSGGVIGMNQVTGEMTKIKIELEKF